MIKATSLKKKSGSIKQKTSTAKNLLVVIFIGAPVFFLTLAGIFGIISLLEGDLFTNDDSSSGTGTDRCAQIPFEITRSSLEWCNHSQKAPGNDKSDWLYCMYSNGNTGFLPPECIPAGVPTQ